MENAILLTGLTIGSFLAFPLFMEWMRKFQVALVLAVGLVISVYGLAPYSPNARAITTAINLFPQTILNAVDCTQDNIAKLGSEYFNAFHS